MARKSNFLIGTRSYCKRAREKYLGNTTPAFLFSHHAIILRGAGTSLRIHGIRVYTYGRTRTFMESLKGGNLHVTRFPAHLSNLIRDFHAMLTQNVSRFSFGLNWRSFCTWSVWAFKRYIPLMPFLILSILNRTAWKHLEKSDFPFTVIAFNPFRLRSIMKSFWSFYTASTLPLLSPFDVWEHCSVPAAWLYM